jgi:hypothetical protein
METKRRVARRDLHYPSPLLHFSFFEGISDVQNDPYHSSPNVFIPSSPGFIALLSQQKQFQIELRSHDIQFMHRGVELPENSQIEGEGHAGIRHISDL